MELVDGKEPVLGVRAWQVRRDGRLCSIHADAPWEPGVNCARCLPDVSLLTKEHEVPEASCTCGLYGNPSVNYRGPAVPDDTNVVLGTIAAWGHVEPECDGFRAEYARILAIGCTGEGSRLERRAATRYSVPLVPFVQLERFSRHHARPLRLEGTTHGGRE
jgi:hypothetical protein